MTAPGPAATREDRPYGALWATPGAWSLTVTGALGRLPNSMNGLGLLLLLRGRAGLGAAALAVAVFTLALALASPVLGRLADARGRRPVLVATGLAHPLALAGVVLVSRAESTELVMATVALAGLTAPPVAACARAAWPRVARSPRVLATAFATDAVMTEVVWILGPLLAGVLSATVGPKAILLASAGFALVGTLGLARHPAVAGPSGPVGPRPAGSIFALPLLPVLVAAELCVCIGLGMILVAIPAYAPGGATAGVLIAVWGVGSGTFGLLAGRHARPASLRQLAVLTGVLALLTLPLAFTASAPVVVVGALLVLAGAPIAPFNTVLYQLVTAAVPPHLGTSAFAWLTTISTAGMAIGSALAGLLLPEGDPGARDLAMLYVLAAALTLAGAAAPAWQVRRRGSSRQVVRTPA